MVVFVSDVIICMVAIADVVDINTIFANIIATNFIIIVAVIVELSLLTL